MADFYERAPRMPREGEMLLITLAALAAAALCALACPGPADTGPDATPARLPVTMTELACKVARSVRPGQAVFRITNHGRRPRSFSIAGRRSPFVKAQRTAVLRVWLMAGRAYRYACAARGKPRSIKRGILRIAGAAIERFTDLSTPWNCWGSAHRNVTMNRVRPTSPCNIWQPGELSVMGPLAVPWASEGGIWEVGTPRGPGFKVVATPEMTSPWGGKLAWLVDVDHLTPWARFLGTTEDWSGKFMFPSTGNPNGFPKDWNAGVLWEHKTETEIGHHIAIDGSTPGGARIRFGVHNAAANNYRFSWANAPIVLGHWYSWRLTMKWSTGSDGFVQGWLDGRRLVNYSGPTIKVGEHPKLQFGYYATRQLRNEVWHAGIRKS
jgi:Polysaccharide lyase